MIEKNSWPTDSDADVLRLLEERNFDFSAVHEVEFNIDFASWPLNKGQRDAILEKLPDAHFIEPDDELMEEGGDSGYVSVTVKSKVTYEFIIQEQKRFNDLFSHLGGFCNSWGVRSPCGA
ncbi:ribonuclease E inhibitor RraB [Pseudoalteromonas sp. MMG012]|uniref:ribonuclease E inhibitor RraB n=1 Tax=Pseudoalteromonas sp. MMG012 TaxID=2822686 RepID=UPI001B3A3198|nr:ribonuclease E inhibitor RraB [Pseudoalteromonas sp. MMG012]MBQ4852898.1 ribonuclease E inhibitor RraB [Pseudoalteromonas sp. MMG012]